MQEINDEVPTIRFPVAYVLARTDSHDPSNIPKGKNKKNHKKIEKPIGDKFQYRDLIVH